MHETQDELDLLVAAETERNFWLEQWTMLLGMASAAVLSADDVMDAMRGDLGPKYKGKTSAEAAPEIRRRVTAWTQARNELINYAKAAQADLQSKAKADRNGTT